jgi:hypothetical protein
MSCFTCFVYAYTIEKEDKIVHLPNSSHVCLVSLFTLLHKSKTKRERKANQVFESI